MLPSALVRQTCLQWPAETRKHSHSAEGEAVGITARRVTVSSLQTLGTLEEGTERLCEQEERAEGCGTKHMIRTQPCMLEHSTAMTCREQVRTHEALPLCEDLYIVNGS